MIYSLFPDGERYGKLLATQTDGWVSAVKKSVIPHKFDCQPHRNQTPLVPKRGAAIKRSQMRLALEAMGSSSQEPTTSSSAVTDSVCMDNNEEFEVAVAEKKKTCDKECQTKRRSFKSRGIMCRTSDFILVKDMKTSPFKISRDVKLSPIKMPSKRQKLNVDEVFTDSSSACGSSTATDNDDSEYSAADDIDDRDSNGDDFNTLMESENIRMQSLQKTRFHSRTQSKRYIGVPHDSLYVVDELTKNFTYAGTWLSREDVVLLVLRKIRLNESFDILADNFGVSKSHASRVFHQFAVKIADALCELIIWPSKETVNRYLPTAFQARYSNVQSIIDCFEIEIEKPTAAVNQALTWSDYKKCNTAKYLVSCTPDGLINFVSKGFGGRVSDMILLENTNYLDMLSPDMDVMADRGFKHVETLIRERGCKLVRPPSVASGEKLSADECKETKRIASLRIHVERLIRRIREFKILTPHSCVDIHMIGKLDYCVQIAAGLINLQGPLIK
jgi:DDE superfamily endonuclease/Helix-turn-helix of DDE superfamily endonuclease